MGNILAVYNLEREETIAAAKKDAAPYLDAGECVKAWTAFVKVMRDGHQKDFMLSVGTVQMLRGGITVGQIRELINGFK